ncbi:S-layer homology domain-containing protein [Cohnella hongkongensis]|uniref:S-layer homology domain-containing protein n=1 Tax=Cohnella hongkongensis TaxID=178337 RepID=A0ABV9FHD5_9BACL
MDADRRHRRFVQQSVHRIAGRKRGAAAAAARAANAGLVSGMPDGTFAPQDRVNRAQAAVLLARFLRHVGFIED